jgi:uncharacterized membrane protein YidH (DUF202 family)
MKHIARLGKNQFIQLDSYGSQYETPVANFLVGLFVIAIAVMTMCAAVGIDITNINQGQTNEHIKR